jgi:hypothetical protein
MALQDRRQDQCAGTRFGIVRTVNVHVLSTAIVALDPWRVNGLAGGLRGLEPLLRVVVVSPYIVVQ